MGIKLYKEPKLEKPDMIVGWRGIGRIGIIAVDTLRGMLRAEELGEIEPWDFFYPRKVSIKKGRLEKLEFPINKFFFKKHIGKDLIFFLGEEQPGQERYAKGERAYQMANLVLDVAERFGCQKVYTSGAAVALTHHTLKPRVWAVPNNKELIEEIKGYQNTVLMSEVEEREKEGSISGLNGLLLGVARERGLDGICLMGEIPEWLAGAPFPYPRASKSVCEVLAHRLRLRMDFSILDRMASQIDKIIKEIYKEFPSELKEWYDQRKLVTRAEPRAITEEDAKWIREHIDELFKKGGGGGERAV